VTERFDETGRSAPAKTVNETTAPVTQPYNREQSGFPANTAISGEVNTGEPGSEAPLDRGPNRARISFGKTDSPGNILGESGDVLSLPSDDPLPSAPEEQQYRVRDSRERMVQPEGGDALMEPIGLDGSETGESVSPGTDANRDMAIKIRKDTRAGHHRIERGNTSFSSVLSGNTAGNDREGNGNNPGEFATRGGARLFGQGEKTLSENDMSFKEIINLQNTETERDSTGESITARFDTERAFRISGTTRGEQVHGYRGISGSSMLETNILNTIVRHAQLLIVNGQSSATITLEPPSLGKLRLEIVAENAKVAGKILVESKEVRDIIRNNLPELRQNLLQNGLQVESFDVQVGHNGGTDSWAQRENLESTAALFRAERTRFLESTGDIAVPARNRSGHAARSPGYLDVWM
jgi:hypothetical protein